jgi:hypothetical protein
MKLGAVGINTILLLQITEPAAPMRANPPQACLRQPSPPLCCWHRSHDAGALGRQLKEQGTAK